MKKLITTALMYLTAICSSLHAGEFDLEVNKIKFTEAPTPFNIGSSVMNMNYRSSFDTPPNNTEFSKLKLIATSQPYSLNKAETVLEMLKIKNTSNVTMVDLRHEVHFNIYIKPTVKVEHFNYDFTIPEGWYSISMVDDNDGDKFKTEDVINYLKNEYLPRHNNILKVYIRYKTLLSSGKIGYEPLDYFVNIPCRPEDIISDQELCTSKLHISYYHIDTWDGEALNISKENGTPVVDDSKIRAFLDEYNKHPNRIYWVHCWGGSGRTSQFVGLFMTLVLHPASLEVLHSNIFSFNNAKDMFEYTSGTTSPGRNFVNKFWEANHNQN